jgi:hypothetical protein
VNFRWSTRVGLAVAYGWVVPLLPAPEALVILPNREIEPNTREGHSRLE